MNIALISLPLIGQKGDPFGNIPSMPVGIAYLAAYLRDKGYDVCLIDSLGLNPRNSYIYKKKYIVHGLNLREIVDRIPKDAEIIGISVHSIDQIALMGDLIKRIKRINKRAKIVAGGASPTTLPIEHLNSGADYIMLGEGEESFQDLILYLKGKKSLREIDGIAYGNKIQHKTKFIKNLDDLPFPSLDLLPLENYWKLGYAHGPVSGRYCFLITSRGCPYNCAFCAAPKIWQQRFRTRSAKNIADEVEHHHQKYKIAEFHIQDDIFTFDIKRVIEFCKEIIRRKIRVRFKIAAGTKAETITREALRWMKKAGFNYISISPESGSKRVLKLMNKPFNHKHGLNLLGWADKMGISTQVCFVIGFPGETSEDLKLTEKYAKQITKAGADELAVYIMTPLPGAKAFEKYNFDFNEYEELCFSPRWRRDYKKLNRFRQNMYLRFMLWRFAYHPAKSLRIPINILTKNFETKSEMTLYRLFKNAFR